MNHTLLLKVGIVLIFFFCTDALWSQCDSQNDTIPPVFTEAVENVSVCPELIPIPVILEANDNCSGLLQIGPVDDTLSVGGFCLGGTITRTWTATDNAGNTTVATQIITVLADTLPPTVETTLENTTEYCGNANFNAWVVNQQSTILTSVVDDCGIGNISNDAPLFLDACGETVVTFTLEDLCGNVANIQATYELLDTIPPVFDNLPRDTTINCTPSPPAVPEVTATDDCGFVENIDFVEISTPTSGNIDCGTFQIIRRWTATDNCGNSTEGVQVIQVIDTIPPEFELPDDINLPCGSSINDLQLTGLITDVEDNCDLTPNVTYVDSLKAMSDFLRVERHWIAEDACGNRNTKVQIILIADDEAPTFTVPPNVEVDCGSVADLSLTGEPTEVNDNCDTELDINYEDVFTTGSCSSGGAIQRIWKVTDNAGNTSEQTQLISLNDEIAPVFELAPQDATIFCGDTTSAESGFKAWIDARASAVVTDNCSSQENLTWFAFNTGTNDPASLADPTCGDLADNVFLTQTVDFVVADECGNTARATATFSIADDQAPIFAYCPPDTTVLANDGGCGANFRLLPPIVVETCSALPGTYTFAVSENIESEAPNNRDVPVNPVRLSFPVIPSNNFASGAASLTINLFNVDGEQSLEYFHVVSEDGERIGRTANVTTQCGNSQTILTDISADQINAWAGTNGLVTFFLEPNITEGQPPRFSINDICAGSRVEATLFFETLTPTNISYEYQLNDGEKNAFLPGVPVFTDLQAGSNFVTYYVTDCVGNTSECSYTVTVNDIDPPIIDCPSDTILQFDADNCVATYQLPLPNTVIDNCGSGNLTSVRLPNTPAEALVSFTFDPDLNDYLADDKEFVFTDVTPSVLSNVILTIEFQGDVDNNNAFFTIVGDDGIPITTTALDQSNVTFGDCNTSSKTTLTIPPFLYNSWAADGEIRITAFSNAAIPIPPGGPGDGVNPCNPSAIDPNTGTDGITSMYATLSFENVQFEYFAGGATSLPIDFISSNQALPSFEFEVGVTEVFYIVKDGSNNTDTCSFTVTVVDDEAPTALCSGTTVSINPSGVDVDTLSLTAFDIGSFDNCGIDTMFLSPSIFDCSYAGQDTANVTLTVIDKSGNQDQCVAPVRIITEVPAPTYFIPPCGGDTLFLFANAPAAVGNNLYTYEWTGPNGFVSNQPNPIITNIDEDNAGSYQVMVTGITSCEAIGIVEVAINDLPVTPDLIVPEKICSNDPLVLMTTIAPENVQVAYRWFEGTIADGQLRGTTSSPSLSLGNTLAPGNYSFYVQVEVEGCESLPSQVQQITVVERPVATVNDPNPAPICEGETIQLSTAVIGTDLEYEWKGPDGFMSNAQIPPVITAELKNDGIYQLVISREDCESEPANTSITVRPRPETPMLSVTSAACEGETLTLRMNVNDASVYRWIEPGGQVRTTVENTLVLDNVTQAATAGVWRGFVSKSGCESEESNALTVEVFNQPKLSISANPAAICDGDVLELKASPIIDGASYEWIGPNEFKSVGSTIVINNVTEATEGTYTCTITTLEGCASTETIEVTYQGRIRITGVSNSGNTECLSSPTEIKLAVTVFPPDDSTYTYEWSGPNNFTSFESIATIPNATASSSGVYTVKVTNGRGCSSSMESTTLSLRDGPAVPTTPIVSESTPAPFCVGDPLTISVEPYTGSRVTYYWSTPRGELTTNIPTLSFNEVDLNNVGEYNVQVEVDGCRSESSGTVRVDINDIPQIIASSNSPVCEGDRLELETSFIPNATYSWTGPGFTSSSIMPVIPVANANLHAGVYRVQAEVDGCRSVQSEIEITVNPLPTKPLAANDGAVCIDSEDATLKLFVPFATSMPGARYVWYDEAFEELNQPTPSLVYEMMDFADFSEGENLFYVEAILNGCSAELSSPTSVIFNTIPSNAAFAGDDIAVCEARSIELNASAPTIGTGMWTQVGGDTSGVVLVNPDDPKTPIFGLEGEGIYTFNWQLSNGACRDYSSDQVDILLNPNEAANAGLQIDTCRVNTLHLNAVKPNVGVGRWTQNSLQESFGVTIDNIFDPNTTIRGLNPGNQYRFTWTVIGGTCNDSNDDAIVIVSNGLAYAGQDRNDCGDGCTILDATPSPTTVGKWSSSNPEVVFNDPTDPKTLVCDLELGENLLIWETDNGACESESIDTVVINFQPLAFAVDDTVTVAFGSALEIDVVENDNFIKNIFTTAVVEQPIHGSLENLGDGIFRYQANSTFAGTDAFVYELCTTGCECSQAVVEIVVGAGTACEIPSIFTPNKDGVNDKFVIPCLNGNTKFPDTEVSIFNQWGDEVFRVKNYQNDWEGTFNSEDLPVGNYFYVIDFGDGSRPASGFIVLQR